MLERENLYGSNFNDWFQVIKLQTPVAPGINAATRELEACIAQYDRYNEVIGLYDILNNLKSIYGKQAESEVFELNKTLHSLHHEQGTPISPHILKMKRYFEQLERLNYAYPSPFIIGIILKSLSKNFEEFVRNYNMHSMDTTIAKLHAMANEYEKKLPKKSAIPQVLTIKGGKVHKGKQPKGKGNKDK
uniref:uncharacterized protein LOC122597553 n=1 Tax=Erigeron canadensis TaxID=72917 RepID=UPI001CB8ED4E|nr:uncharacterized protein LOC122597553 [Erigeron canadensis]